jgi:hypothetical protein
MSQPTRIPSAFEPRTANRGQRHPPQAGRQPQTWYRPERAIALAFAADAGRCSCFQSNTALSRNRGRVSELL